jgi:hypothetical protein
VLPASVVIDHNLLSKDRSTALYGNYLGYVRGHGNTDTLARLRSWTGYERHGISADPGFVDRSGHDYRLRTTYPAVNRGVVVLGESFKGAAPDLGRYELR